MEVVFDDVATFVGKGNDMAFGSIEFTTISRAQDYSAIKHNEDNKGMVDQNNFSGQVQKSVEQMVRQVKSSDNAQWYEKKPDAKEKGNGKYSGDGGKNRKKQQAAKPQEKMVVKNAGGFDLKI
ncbi:hypothetical protein D7X48_17325 [bacterium D16-50]|nr:hypothetical protein D7X48_17325 [bacterium D16-50]